MNQPTDREQLLRIIRAARRRVRLRVALHGATIVLGAGLVVALLGAVVVDHFRFAPAVVTALRVVGILGVGALAAWFIGRPLARSVSDDRIALYLEEHQPELDAYVLSAVSFAKEPGDTGPRASRALLDRLVAEAVARCAAIDYGRRIERPRLMRSSGLLAGIMAAGMLLFLLAPGPWRRGASALLPWMSAVERNPYAIQVVPGDTLVARGSDLRVGARLQNFDADPVEIVVKRGQDAQWQRFPMPADVDSGGYAIVLFDLAQPADYFVEAGGVRSAIAHITVADIPHAQTIAIEYHFPAYTGLPVQRVEQGGDIAALRGTRARLEVTPTIAVSAAALLVGGKDTIPLAQATGTAAPWTGDLRVQTPGSYRVLFQMQGGRWVAGSSDYLIDVLSDQPPVVQIKTPGRDLKVTAVQEVYTEVEAQDDYGVDRVDLVYSVNGGPEQTIPLTDKGRRKEVVAGHTFFLEEQRLTPGDIISYYARATDGAPRGGEGPGARSDIYFMEVRPFDLAYRQADQQPAGMGGEGMSGDELSERQREVIAGTFNVIRDRSRYSDDEYGEHLATLALSQGKLREDVGTLVERIRSRGVIGMDSTFALIAAALDSAVKEMKPAEDRLGERKADEALPPEQRALRQLQHAEAVYREVQVSQQSGASGSSGRSSSAEDLADLFDLEMDKLRNQYEQLDRGQREQANNQLDELAEKLRELAQRQQQENERARARAAQMQSGAGAGGAGGGGQRQLADQADSLARQLERLARERPDSRRELEETAQRLKSAAEAMRRAAAQSGDAGSAQGRAATDALRDAQRLLDQDRGNRLRRDIDDAARRANQLARDQEQVRAAVDRFKQSGGADGEQLNRLDQRKSDMAGQVEALESDLDRMSRDSRRDQPEASRKLADAASGIRDDKLKEKIMFSRGVMRNGTPDYARNFEDQIGGDIARLQERIADAGDAVGQSREQKLAQSLDKTRDLVNGLQSLDDRLRAQSDRPAQGNQSGRADQQGARDQQAQPGQSGQEAQPGQQGQEGQPGGQQGQAGGRQGQQGQGGEGQQQGQGRGRGDNPQGTPGGQPGGQPPSGESGGDSRPQPGMSPRQFSREFGQRLEDAQGLRGELSRQGVDVRDLDALIERMRRMDSGTLFNDPRQLAELENSVIQGLKEFEFGLRRELMAGDDQRVFVRGSDEVPEKYRKLVEDYYKSLSEIRKKQP